MEHNATVRKCIDNIMVGGGMLYCNHVFLIVPTLDIPFDVACRRVSPFSARWRRRNSHR